MIHDSNTFYVSTKTSDKQLSIPILSDFFQNTDVFTNTKEKCVSQQQSTVFLCYKAIRIGSPQCPAKTACCAYIFKNNVVGDKTLVLFGGSQMDHPFQEKRSIRRKLCHTATERLAIRPSSFLHSVPTVRYELEPFVFRAYFQPGSRGIRPIGGDIKFTSYYIGIRDALSTLFQTSCTKGELKKEMYRTVIHQLLSTPSHLVPVAIDEPIMQSQDNHTATLLSFSDIACALQMILNDRIIS